MNDEKRNYITMADKSVGKCSSGHWLPLKGDCDLCGAGPCEECLYTAVSDTDLGKPLSGHAKRS